MDEDTNGLPDELFVNDPNDIYDEDEPQNINHKPKRTKGLSIVILLLAMAAVYLVFSCFRSTQIKVPSTNSSGDKVLIPAIGWATTEKEPVKPTTKTDTSVPSDPVPTQMAPVSVQPNSTITLIRCKYCNGDGFVSKNGIQPGSCGRTDTKCIDGFIECPKCKGKKCDYCLFTGHILCKYCYEECKYCNGFGYFLSP